MFVIPYFTKPQIETTIDWAFLPVYLFLDNKGRQLWYCEESEQEILQVILPENGFHIKSHWKQGDRLYVEIDTNLTNIHNFYSFEEVTRKKEKGKEECWRRFFVFVCKKESEKHLETFWFNNLEKNIIEILESISNKNEHFKRY
jgi:hypothetical protein